MAGETATPPAPAAPAAGDPPAPAAGAAAPAAGGEGAGSARAVLADLADERNKRQAAEAERDALKAKHQTETEKAIDAARKEGESTATLAANKRIVRSEIKGLAGGKVSDPEDVAALLGDLDRFIVKGEVDSKAISTAIDELVKAKPYLAPPGRARPLPGGGATQPSGVSLNDDIRRRAGRG